MRSKKFYVTTSIAYTNSIPHIGFALEVVQADVIARYRRSQGKDVFFLTGTDEHGAKIVKAAIEAQKNPKEFTDQISSQFRKLADILNLSISDFIRTTDQKKHWPSVKKVWQKLKKNGDIYKKQYYGLYCVGCEAFITKKDLIEGKCAIHKTASEVVEEENYFFKLSKYQNQIKKAIKEEKLKIIPERRKNEMLSFISQGLEDVSFSRPRKNLKWAIPVPDDDSQTIYVWADALVNYISALGYEKNSPKFKKFWPADVHCIGKDILRFHATIWPGMLLSLGSPLPKNIFVHGFITSGGQKMSKSLGNVVDPFELVKKYGSAGSPQAGTDAVRYFLLREIPPVEDGDFTFEKFEARYNADLAKGLGNLVSRVIALCGKLKIKNEKAKTTIKNLKLKKFIRQTRKKCSKALDEFKFNEALAVIWDLISYCDKYIEQTRPWEQSKNQRTAIKELLFALGNIAELLEPFLPETAGKIKAQLKTLQSKPLFPRTDLDKSF